MIRAGIVDLGRRRELAARPAYRPKRPRCSVARKLDPWRVKSMRAMYDRGEKVALIATLYGVADTTAWKVCTRVTWRHVA